MIKWPQGLISDLARRRTVLFLGSGISRNSKNAAGRHPKTWYEFLNDLLGGMNPNRYVKSLLKERDYLTACEVVKQALGKDQFNQSLRAEYLTPAYSHAPIHETIFNLDSRIVATPNFDKIYESYANHRAGASIVVKHHYDPDVAETIRTTDRIILKVHGTIDSVDRMIFTRKEYAEARQKYRGFYELLEALALTHTFLFLGCGVNDPDLRLLLEDVFSKNPSAKPHIFVLPRTALHEKVRKAVENSMNLTILTYSAVGDHKELADSLIELGSATELEREEIARTRNW